MSGWASEIELGETFATSISKFYSISQDLPFLAFRLDYRKKCQEFTFSEEFLEESLGKVEKSGFWALYRVKLVSEWMKSNQYLEMVEIGAGNGAMAIPLSKTGIKVIGVEPSLVGALQLAKNEILTVHDSLENLSVKTQNINVLGIFDVLGHVNNPLTFLQRLFPLVENLGWIVCLVPSHKHLFSDYDRAICQQRRFSRAETINLFNMSGFEITECRYVFSALFLPSLFLRRIPYLFGRSQKVDYFVKKSKGQVGRSFGMTKSLIKIISFFDKFKLPFGLSILVIAQKKQISNGD